MGAVISVRVLGPIEGWVGDRRVELAGPRQLGLFALLALNANRAVSSDVIVEKLWGSERGGANKSLQMTVARIRKALTAAGADAEATLRTVGHGYLLAVTVDQLDSEQFSSQTAAGQDALQAADPERARQVLGEALALWRGPPLPEVGFDDFAQGEIRRLEELRLLAIEAHAEADLMLGRHAELTGELSTLLIEHPDRERLAGQLMLALYRCGRQNEALEIYQHVRAHLLKGAGLAPGPVLQELQGRILQQDPALETPTRSTTLPSAVDVNAMDNAHLPTPSSTLIGRGGEITAISDLLTDGTRPVTLTGPGGVGKTRMAVEVAHRIGGQQRDGVRFVELAALADPDLVPATVAAEVGVRLEPGADAISTLIAELADREQLLVIDNCEHVLDAAAALVAQLAQRCRGLTVLATSREPLQIDGEAVHRVPSLSIPSEDLLTFGSDGRLLQVGADESVQLLIERARAHRPDFELTAENVDAVVAVCRQLDGIPLAIELAAPRLRSISIEDLSARLDQQYGLLIDRSRRRTPRHQTLTALLDWSYELLSAPEQQLFTYLAVFTGGFDLDAVEQVGADNEGHRFELADLLGALVDKSLVGVVGRPGVFRYRMLEPVREYAQTKLDSDDRQAARIRTAHRDHYLALAERTTVRLGELNRNDRIAAADRLAGELANLRAAERFSLRDPNPEPGLRLVAALARFSRERGLEDENRQALQAHLARPEAAEPTRARSKALQEVATTVSFAGSLDDAVEFVSEALTIARSLKDRELTTRALHELGYFRHLQGDYEGSLQVLDEALALARELNQPRVTAGVLVTLSNPQRELGHDAGPSLSEALRLYRLARSDGGMASALCSIGELEEEHGDLDNARLHLQEALDILRELQIPAGILTVAGNLARVTHRLGDDASARPLALESAQRAFALRLTYSLAYALQTLALSVAASDATFAVNLHGAADRYASQIGLQYESLETQIRATELDQLRAQLGDARFQAAYHDGECRSHEELIAQANSTIRTLVSSAEGPARNQHRTLRQQTTGLATN